MKRFLLVGMLLAACVLVVARFVDQGFAAFASDPLTPMLLVGVTSTTLTELTDLAKDYFTNVYSQLVNPETPLKAQFARLEDALYTGKKWIFGVKLQIGGGSANAGARSKLPRAEQGIYDQGESTVVRTYTRMALDGLAIEVTKRQTGSFRPAIAEVMQDRLQAHDLEVNRQLYCPGNGVLADVPTGVANATQTLGTDFRATNGGLGTRHLYVGDLVEFYDGATLTTKRAGGPFRVTAVNSAADQITVHTSVTTTNGDVVTRATDSTDNILQGEAKGLLVAVSTSTPFEGIPNTYQGWNGVVLGNGGTLRAISDGLVMQMLETIRARCRQLPDLVVTRPGIVLKYSEIFLPIRRINGQEIQLRGGYKPLSAIQHAGGEIPVIGDLDCPSSRMFFLNTSCFRMADLIGTEWADMDGAVFDRVTDEDGVEGYIRKYWQLITIARNGNGVIEDLEDIAAIEKVIV